jgi:hypothetical protein
MKREDSPIGRIFVCVNEKAPEKAQCLAGEGEKVVSWLRDEVNKRGLMQDVWVTRTKCQSYCATDGTVITFEPTHKQFSSVLLKDVPSLLEEFLSEIDLKPKSQS